MLQCGDGTVRVIDNLRATSGPAGAGRKARKRRGQQLRGAPTGLAVAANRRAASSRSERPRRASRPRSIAPPAGRRSGLARRKLFRISPRASRLEEGWAGSTKLRRTWPPRASTKVMRPPAPTLSTIPARSAHSGVGATPRRVEEEDVARAGVRGAPPGDGPCAGTPRAPGCCRRCRSEGRRHGAPAPRRRPPRRRPPPCSRGPEPWTPGNALPRSAPPGRPRARRRGCGREASRSRARRGQGPTIIAKKTSSQRNRRSPGSGRDMRPSYDM